MGLRQQTFACVDQQHRNICITRTGHHVAGVLLMSRTIRNNELALGGVEVTVGDINRDSLLALRHQAIG